MPTYYSVPLQPADPASPCIRQCTLDDDDVCIGCGRHVDEITGWTQMSVAQQRAVVTQSAQRVHERRARYMNSEQEVIHHGSKR